MGRDRASRPEAKPLRLFVAVEMREEQRTAVAAAIEPWRDRLPGGRWESPEKWHVTLKFLGRTFPRLVPWVEERCREVAGRVAPFDVSLGGLGVFPAGSRARVLWVGIDDPGGGLVELAAGLEDGLAPEFRAEKRPFTPHLTVARFREPVRVRDQVEELRATRVEAEPFAVDRLLLVRSHLMGPRGSRYETIGECPLGR